MKNIFSNILLMCYFLIGFLGNFGAIDRVASHYIFLNIINLFGLFYFLLKPNFTLKTFFFKRLTQTLPFKILIVFLVWASLSFFYSINKLETIISLIRLITLVISFSLIINLLYEIKTLKYLLLFGFFPVIILEILVPFNVFLDIYSVNKSFTYNLSDSLETFTPNKNITAAIIACHLPLLLIISKDYKILNIITPALFVIAGVDLFLLSSRAILLGLIISIFFSVLIYFFFKIKNFRKLLIFSTSIIFSIFLASSIIKNDGSIQIKERLSNIDSTEASTNERLRYYSHGLTHIKNNPFIGLGLGSWKLKSIEYDKDNIKSYIVPYHLHNDFLQYGTELGIIGMILYGLVFFFILLENLKKIKTNTIFSTALIISISIFFIDSNLNFPHHRPIMMIFLGFIIALTKYNSDHELS